MIIVLERDSAGEGKVGAAVEACFCEMIIAGEAMHHDPRRHPLGVDHVQNVVVGVAIMDDESSVIGLGKGDMYRKCLSLHRLTSRIAGPEIVQAALPHRPDPRMPGELLNQVQA